MKKIIFFRVLGAILLLIAVSIMTISYLFIAINDGIWEVIEMLNPFNIWNFFATILILSPAMICFIIADRLKKICNYEKNH